MRTSNFVSRKEDIALNTIYTFIIPGSLTFLRRAYYYIIKSTFVMLRFIYALKIIPLFLFFLLLFMGSCSDSYYQNQILGSLDLDDAALSRARLKELESTVRDPLLLKKIQILDLYMEHSLNTDSIIYQAFDNSIISELDELIPFLIEEKDSLTVSVAFFIKGIYLYSRQEFIASFSSFANASEFAQELNQNQLKYNIFNSLSDIYNEYGAFESEIFNRELSLFYANETRNDELIINTTHKLASAYISNDSTTCLAIPILKNTLTRFPKEKISPNIYADLADFYNQFGYIDSAKHYIQIASAQLKDSMICHDLYRIMGDICLNNKQYESAQFNYTQTKNCSVFKNKLHGLYGLYQTNAKLGNHAEAYKYIDQFCAILDSTINHPKQIELERIKDVEAYKLQRRILIDNQIEKYKSENKNQRNILFLICLIGSLLIALLLIHSRKVKLAREIMRKKALFLEEQNKIMNKLLKEQEEKERLLLNEQIMKTEYYKRLNLISVPILSAPKNKHGFIFLSKNDWDVIIENTNACFDSFTKRLEKKFPEMREDDIRFCCLIKMETSLNLLASIYHVEKSSISKKKTRLKEKLKINEKTLDEFIRLF